jgi:membrane protein
VRGPYEWTVDAHSTDEQPPLKPEERRRAARRRGSGQRTSVWQVVRRVAAGTWDDGFIHAGNLAYMTLLALFPFFIAVAAIFSILGAQGQLDASIDALLTTLPPRVSEVLDPVARSVVEARHGMLLWIGGLIGIWTATSLIETIRDILHRAYGTAHTRVFWRHRLLSALLIFGAVLLLLVSLSAQVVIAAAQEVFALLFPRIDVFFGQILISRLVTAGTLALSIYALFRLLTPRAYQGRRYPKWPGALLVACWWLIVAFAMPRVLRNFIVYDLTYGSLAGVMITLFFFWLVGLGMVVGAELNAALAVSPEEQDMLGENGAARSHIAAPQGATRTDI